MAERRTIVVAGAGIAGLTSALALAASGYAVVIAERAAELSEAGAGIQLSPNAGKVLAALGLDAKIAARAIEPDAIAVWNGRSGRLLTSVHGRRFRERYGAPYRVLHRGDLQALLAAAVTAHPAIRLVCDATVAARHEQEDGLLVRIRKGSTAEVVMAAALIGADGVWSATREAIAKSARPMFSGRTAWRAIVPADLARDLVAMDSVGLHLGPDAHLVHYPVAQGAAVNIVAIVREDWDKRGWSAVGDRSDIVRRFAGWSPAVRALIAAPVAWHKFAIATVDATASWAEGRVALVGDAAHAMAPFIAQGAAMAMEDAAVLADRLYGAADVPAALKAYEAERKGRVLKVATAATATARRYHDDGAIAFARDVALRLMGERLILARNDWIYHWQPPGRG